MDADTLGIALRGAERILATSFGGLCTFWGYRLFRITTEKQGEINLTNGKDVKVSLKDVSAGTCFGAFGMAVLLLGLFHGGFSTTDTTTTPGDSKPSSTVGGTMSTSGDGNTDVSESGSSTSTTTTHTRTERIEEARRRKQYLEWLQRHPIVSPRSDSQQSDSSDSQSAASPSPAGTSPAAVSGP